MIGFPTQNRKVLLFVVSGLRFSHGLKVKIKDKANKLLDCL